MIPKKVKVGGFNYDILYPWRFREDDSFLGLHESKELRIKITNNYRGSHVPKDKIRQTLLHELFHAIDMYYVGHALSDEDIIIERFAAGWFNVLNNNKLGLNSKRFKVPDEVKIGEFKYKIDYPYEYNDISPAPQFTVDTNLVVIRLSEEHLFYSPQLLKLNLVHAIMITIDSEQCILESSSLSHDGMIGPYTRWDTLEFLAYGWFQVLVDNDLEKVIKSG